MFRGKFEFQISEFYNDNDNFGKVYFKCMKSMHKYM